MCYLTEWSAVRKHLLLVYRVRNASNGCEKRTQCAKMIKNRLIGLNGSISTVGHGPQRVHRAQRTSARYTRQVRVGCRATRVALGLARRTGEGGVAGGGREVAGGGKGVASARMATWRRMVRRHPPALRALYVAHRGAPDPGFRCSRWLPDVYFGGPNLSGVEIFWAPKIVPQTRNVGFSWILPINRPF